MSWQPPPPPQRGGAAPGSHHLSVQPPNNQHGQANPHYATGPNARNQTPSSQLIQGSFAPPPPPRPPASLPLRPPPPPSSQSNGRGGSNNNYLSSHSNQPPPPQQWGSQAPPNASTPFRHHQPPHPSLGPPARPPPSTPNGNGYSTPHYPPPQPPHPHPSSNGGGGLSTPQQLPPRNLHTPHKPSSLYQQPPPTSGPSSFRPPPTPPQPPPPPPMSMPMHATPSHSVRNVFPGYAPPTSTSTSMSMRPPPPPPMATTTHNFAMNSSALPQPPPLRPPPPPQQYQQQQHLQQQQQQQQQQQPTPQLDPSQLPSADPPTRPHHSTALPLYYPKAHFIHGDFGASGALPPPADSRFLVLDDGNASPMLLRSTMYAIPQDASILRQTGTLGSNSDSTGMAVLCTPMALPSQDYMGNNNNINDNYGTAFPQKHQPQQPESGRLGYIALDRTVNPLSPPRCQRCLAYINPFFGGDSSTSTTMCNFCGTKQSSSSTATATVGLGRGVGSIEYNVAGPYITRPTPVQPHVIYAVDVTAPHCLEYLQLLLQDVIPAWARQQPSQQQQQQQQQGEKLQFTRTAIVLVSCRGVYIPAKDGTGFHIMPDVQQDPYCPLPLEEWSWNLGTEHENMQSTWTEIMSSLIPKLLQDIHNPSGGGSSSSSSGHALTCAGAALAFLADALQESGGRAIWISWRRPNYGAGSIADRERQCKDKAYYENEPLMYTPLQDLLLHSNSSTSSSDAAKFYQSIADKCAKAKIAMDIVLHTNPQVPRAFIDVATLSKVCQSTNGRLTWISHPTSNNSHWKECIKEALLRSLQFTGWDAVLKVRCSTGLRVKSLQTSVGKMTNLGTLTDDSPELELNVVTPDTCIGVTLEHRVGGLPKNTKFVFVQSALLFTNPWTGQRRVRVSTLALRVAPSAAIAFRSMDFGTVAALQLRKAAMSLMPTNESAGDEALVRARHEAMEFCLNVFVAHAKNVKDSKSQIPMLQLILPEKLRLLPLFVMCLLKSPLLRNSLPARMNGLQSAVPTPNGDERAYLLQYAAQATPSMAFWMVQPLLIDAQHPKLNRWQQPGAKLPEDALRLEFLKHAPYVEIPDPVLPTISNLADDKIYLLDTILVMYVIVGKDVDAEQIAQVRSYVSGEHRQDDDDEFPMSRAVDQLRMWSQVGREPRWLRPLHAPLIYVHHDDALYQSVIAQWMVCDGCFGQRDYMSFLLDLKQRLHARLKS